MASDYNVWIYHNHHRGNDYHDHGRARTLALALKQIKDHDTFQLNGRRS